MWKRGGQGQREAVNILAVKCIHPGWQLSKFALENIKVK